MNAKIDYQQLQDFMLGKAKGARARLIEAGIEADSNLAAAAAQVPSDGSPASGNSNRLR